MRYIYQGDKDISSLVESVTQGSSVVFQFFKETGVFFSDEEVKKLESWLTDYAEMLYFNGKSDRLNNKSDISESKEVSTFLGDLRSFEV